MSRCNHERSSVLLRGHEEIEVVEKSIDWLHPFDEALIPLGDYVVVALSWLVSNFRPAFQAIRMPVDYILKNIELGLLWLPQPILLLLVVLVGWRLGRARLAIGSLGALVAIGLIGAWSERSEEHTS